MVKSEKRIQEMRRLHEAARMTFPREVVLAIQPRGEPVQLEVDERKLRDEQDWERRVERFERRRRLSYQHGW